jgi:hypothetical protein
MKSKFCEKRRESGIQVVIHDILKRGIPNTVEFSVWRCPQRRKFSRISKGNGMVY